MARLEKWAAYLWALAAVWTVVAFATKGVSTLIAIILMVTIIGYPLGWAMLFLPTVFLYMTSAAPIYFMLRRRAPVVGMFTAIVIVGAAAVAVPMHANQEINRLASSIDDGDGGTPVTLPAGRTVAYLIGTSADWARECEGTCQRLLLSGTAKVVLLGGTAALTGREPLSRYWIGPGRPPCPDVRWRTVPADDVDVGRRAPYPRPYLTSKFASTYGDDKCPYDGRGALAEADFVLTHEIGLKPAPMQLFNPRLFQIDYFERQVVYLREGAKLRPLMRRSYATARLLRVPLTLDAPFSFDSYTPGGWGRSGTISAGKQLPNTYDIDRRGSDHLPGHLNNDLRVGGLVDEWGRPFPRAVPIEP